MGRTQLTREVGLYKATVWLEPIPVNQLFGQKNYLVLTCKSTATTITTRPQTRLQNKQGHTTSPPEDDMITIEKNEHQNTKQFHEIRHVARVTAADLGGEGQHDAMS
jgi:hypothetical protein